MSSPYSHISGWGKYVPTKVLTNHDLEKMVDTSHEWIVQRTGIHERRLAADGETTTTMAIAASRQALARAGLTPADLDLIISPQFLSPATAAKIPPMSAAEYP